MESWLGYKEGVAFDTSDDVTRANRRHFTISAGSLQHVDKEIPQLQLQLPQNEAMNSPSSVNQEDTTSRNEISTAKNLDLSSEDLNTPSSSPLLRKKVKKQKAKRNTISSNFRTLLDSPRKKKRNSTAEDLRLDTSKLRNDGRTKSSPRSFSVRMASPSFSLRSARKPEKEKGSKNRQLTKSSSFKNVKKLEEQETQDSGEKTQEITKEEIQKCLMNDPKAFMKLVDEEYKRASIMFQSNGLSTSGLTEEDKLILEQLHRIQNRQSAQERRSLREQAFKERYTITKLLQESSGEPRKLHPIMQELFDTERSFLERMKTVCKLFLNPIREQQILNAFETVSLFSNIESVVECNEEILGDLEIAFTISNDDKLIEPTYEQWIGEIFSHYVLKLQPIYSVYCTNQPTIATTLREYQQRPQFTSFVRTQCRNVECKRQDLTSLLISPLQRLCKYPLLLKELLKITPEASNAYVAVENALKIFRTCVDEVNAKVKRVENVTKLAAVQMELSNGNNFRNLIIDPSREFIMKEYMIVNEKIRNVYLFDHLILITKQTPVELKLKPESEEVEHYIIHVLLMNFIEIREIEEDNAFEINCNAVYLFQCKDQEQWKKWVKVIRQLAKAPVSLAPQEVELRARTISLDREKDKGKKRSGKFSFSGSISRKSDSYSHSSIEKLQKSLRSEQLRRQVEQDNTSVYKERYNELEEKYNRERKIHLDEILQLQTTIEELKAENLKLQQHIARLET